MGIVLLQNNSCGYTLKIFLFLTVSNRSKVFRRSIFTTKNIKKGEKFTKDNIRIIRPGYGLMPKYFNKILNKRSPVKISMHEPLKPKMFKNLY